MYLNLSCATLECIPAHQNIVDLIEVIIDGNPTPGRLSTVALVFEYLDHDLSGLLDTPEAASRITPALAKSYMMQLVDGVSAEEMKQAMLHQGNCRSNEICRRSVYFGSNARLRSIEGEAVSYHE